MMASVTPDRSEHGGVPFTALDEPTLTETRVVPRTPFLTAAERRAGRTYEDVR